MAVLLRGIRAAAAAALHRVRDKQVHKSCWTERPFVFQAQYRFTSSQPTLQCSGACILVHRSNLLASVNFEPNWIGPWPIVLNKPKVYLSQLRKLVQAKKRLNSASGKENFCTARASGRPTCYGCHRLSVSLAVWDLSNCRSSWNITRCNEI